MPFPRQLLTTSRNLNSYVFSNGLFKSKESNKFRYLATLVVPEPINIKTNISHSIFCSLNAANSFNQPIHLFLTGKECQSIASALSSHPKIKKIYLNSGLPSDESLADGLSDSIVNIIKQEQITTVIGPVCSMIKDIFPRCAAYLDVQPISDVIEIKDTSTFVRMIYACNAISTIKSHDLIKIISIRTSSFDKQIDLGDNPNIAIIEKMNTLLERKINWVKNTQTISDTVKLDNAKTIVSGGRALKNENNFNSLLTPLCQKLNAALGASRAAVDSGYVKNDLQIGQTGKIVAPDLYFAIGISGAIQHLAGIKDSKIIVAINKDSDAPIFQVADYGLIDDLFKVIPELTTKIKKSS